MPPLSPVTSGPTLLPLRSSRFAEPSLVLLALLGAALQTLPAAHAAQPAAAVPAAAAASLALPGCRSALGLDATAPADRLLRADPALPSRLAATPACRPATDALSRLERLEADLAASRQRIAAQQAQLAAETTRQEALARDLAELRQQIRPGSVAATATTTTAAAPSPPPVQYVPGKGFALEAGGASLRVAAEAKLLGFSSSRYTFNPGQPLVVSPKDPAASYDLSAQQSTVKAAFQGPKWGEWTPGAYALFTLQDNLLAEGYSFTPVAFYGEIGNGRWRIAAGQNFDVFAPRDPSTIPSGMLAATGNPGSYRPQFRVERSFESGKGFGGIVQLAASSPITTALPKTLDIANLSSQELVEDNGWPNGEARLSFGFGSMAERAGGRRLRPVELGISGVVGQLRVLDNIQATGPITLIADRTVVNVWGAALDGQIALGRNVGVSGELYTGQGLGEYMAGIFQSFNRLSNRAVPTSGGWAQLYLYPADNLRFNVGYGIDHATDAGAFSLTMNSAVFANLLWDVNSWLQLGLEGNYKLTTYDVFGNKNAWVVISQVLFRL